MSSQGQQDNLLPIRHVKTYIRIANGFDLTQEQTYEALKRWLPFCKPPWKEQLLRYKAAEAQKVEHEKPRGHFLHPSQAIHPWGSGHVSARISISGMTASTASRARDLLPHVAKEKGENGSVVTLG